MPDVQQLYNSLESCAICPRECGVNRFAGETGICGMDSKLSISSYGPHYGEEPEIVGHTASGTVFLTGCSLLCNFCQNYDISHLRHGRRTSEAELTGIMLALQDAGCSNINFVTPSHYSPQLIRAVINARSQGLNIPIVYNSGGYDKTATLKYWEGIADIYMPDIKFHSRELSARYAGAPDYFEVAASALLEMHRQAGDLIVENGTAKRGLLVRHLVMPGCTEDSKKIIDFIAENIGANTRLNIMEQYRPCYGAGSTPEINRTINMEEYREVVEYAESLGVYLTNYK